MLEMRLITHFVSVYVTDVPLPVSSLRSLLAVAMTTTRNRLRSPSHTYLPDSTLNVV